MTQYARTPAQLERLTADLNELARFGSDDVLGGINRTAYSPVYREACEWLMDRMEDAGLSPRIDAAGNVIGRLGAADGPAVVCGSHIDTVPNGGKYDGALGVLAGLEAARCIKTEALDMSYALEIVAFADEEGAYVSLLGSRAMVGDVTQEEIDSSIGRDHVPFADVLKNYGLDPMRIPDARRPQEDLAAYLELHIEQGPVLESRNLEIGIVESIVGIQTSRFTFRGQANHAGTTPVPLRRDALRAASAFMTRCYGDLEKDLNNDVRLTFGALEVFPGASNVVPAEVSGTQEIRAAHGGDLDRVYDQTVEIAEGVAGIGNVGFSSRILSRDEPARMSSGMLKLVSDQCKTYGCSHVTMPSGAGHDAQVMAAHCDAGLIFIPSRHGISHNAKEFTPEQNIKIGADILYMALSQLVQDQSR